MSLIEEKHSIPLLEHEYRVKSIKISVFMSFHIQYPVGEDFLENENPY